MANYILFYVIAVSVIKAVSALLRSIKRAFCGGLKALLHSPQAMRLLPIILLCIFGAALPLRSAYAQVGIGFVDPGWYQGTIGSNKGAKAGYRCTNGGVMRGVYHVDKQNPFPPMGSAAGMTEQAGIYCSLVIMTEDKVPHVYPTTPDGTPSVLGPAYRGPGAVQSAYCPVNQIVASMGGEARSSTGWMWSSNFSIMCRPLKVVSGDWMAIDTDAPTTTAKAGNTEAPWKHIFTGWFCKASDSTAVNGIYRQAGGEGWDGVNIYCANVQQARLSARIMFDHFDWDKTVWQGPGDSKSSWKTDLTLNAQVLEQTVLDPATGETVTISGRAKRPYSNLPGAMDNNPNVFQNDYEIYVLPGKGYGADLTQRPDIPPQSYKATSTCVDTVTLANHEDSTCELRVVGRPDIAVTIGVPQDDDLKPIPFLEVGDTQMITLDAINMGATAARGAAGFTLDADIPVGWTPKPDADKKCKITGQHVSCAITADMNSAPDPSDNSDGSGSGGTVEFQFPITANASAKPGYYNVPLKLGRTKPDGDGNIYDSDYNTANDTDTGVIRFAQKPRLSLIKTTLDGTGSFTFSGNNGWKDQTIATDAANTPKAGATQILTQPAQTQITETLPSSADPAYQWVMLDADKGTACTGLGADDSTTPPTPGTAAIDTKSGSVTFDMLATDYNTNITCKVVNQIITTRTAKTSDIGNNAPVQSGDEITYTITTTVVGAPTAKDTVITDTMDGNIEYEGVTSQGDFSAIDASAAPVLKMTLPAGAAVGPHSISYKVKVIAHAKGAVVNTAVSNNGFCDACSTQNPLVQIATVKKSDIGGGNPISTGAVITYTLTTTVTGGPTTNPVVLSDFISGDLDFVAVKSAGAFQTNIKQKNNPVFTLPKGTKPGTYEVTYTAQVKADISGDTAGAISNQVTSDHGSCDQCATSNPVVSVNVSKESDIGSGAQLQNGQIVTYKLHATIKGGSSFYPTVLTDTLSAGLTFQKVTDAGGFTAAISAAPVLKFTLPKGTPAGTYTVTYTARVNDNATGSVQNNVTASGAVCDNCSTKNPVTAVSVSKSAKPAPGKPIERGDTVMYTVLVKVTGGATTKPITLTDTLGSGLAFDSVIDPTPFTADTSAAPVLKFTLPEGTPAGNYDFSYSAKVTDNATGTVGNNLVTDTGLCPQCSTSHPIVTVNAVKAASIPAGSGAQPGDTITYTITTTVAGGPLTKPTVLTDLLGEGQTFGKIVRADSQYNANTKSNPISVTLPAGTTKPGTYKFTYTAIVNPDATAAGLTNSIMPSGGTHCDPCETDVPLVNIVSNKSVDAGAGSPVQPGDTLTYTLTTTISGAAATHDIVLTDSLNPSLSFAGIAGKTPFKANTTNQAAMSFTLPAGTKPGTYGVSYKAQVKTAATVAADNKLTPNSGACPSCDVVNPLVSIATVKTSDVGDGTAVQRGDTITYTLTATVTGGATTQDLILTDKLGSSLSFNHIVSAGDFIPMTDNAPVLSFTLPAGAAPGTYSVSYAVDVNDNASAAAANNVTANHGSCDKCSANNPLVEVTTNKTSDIGDGTAVERGDIITYTLTANVAGGATTGPIILSDTLDPNLQYADVSDNSGGFTVNANAAPVLKFILPTGAAAGPHKVSYQAKVRESAGTYVANKVTSSYDRCDNCSTKNPTVNYATSKSTSLPAGGAAQIGDTITYTLQVTVTGGTTTKDMTLTDSPGKGLVYNETTDQGVFTVDDSNPAALKFTLPAGTDPGTYAISYTATVSSDAMAAGAVSNAVVPSAGSCSSCSAVTPLVTLDAVKTVSPQSGSYVQRGDTLTYTLAVTVKGGATSQPVVLSDTLGDGLTFGKITNAGAFTGDVAADNKHILFTLPAGKPAGLYKISYTATVGKDAGKTVGNNAVFMNSDGSTTPCPSGNCSTNNPITEIKVSKSAVPAGAAQIGDVIIYTASVTVTGGPTSQDTVLTDTLGKGLAFGRVVAGGKFTSDTSKSPVLKFTLPKGAAQGTYLLRYTAIVTKDAQGQVANNIITNNGDCESCSAVSPIVTTDVVKTANPPAGESVSIGDTITYTITATVKGGATTKPLVVTDTAGAGLSIDSDSINKGGFSSAKAPGVFSPNTLSFTLNKGAAAGTYTATYQAKVTDNAVTSVLNSVKPSSGDCSACETQNPIVNVHVSKTVKNSSAEPGDVLEYTLTATVDGGATGKDLALSDTLDPKTAFIGINAGSKFRLSQSDAHNPVFILPKGTPAGTYSVTYRAKLQAGATGAADNKVTASGGVCDDCSTSTPITAYSAAKTSDAPAGGAQAGDIINYTVTVTVANGASTQPLMLTDNLGRGLQFAGVKDAGKFTADLGGAQPVFTLPAGQPAGQYSITYAAKVTDDAAGALTNSITPNKGDCDKCSAQTPLVSLVTSKSVSPQGNVQPGDTLTYTLAVTVSGGETTQDTVLSDTLGAGLTYGDMIDNDGGLFMDNTSDPQRPSFTLPAGAAAGTYKVRYTATLAKGASAAAHNTVSPNNGACEGCEADNPLVSVTSSKSVSPAGAAQKGDILTYTLTVHVENGPTTQPTMLADRLGSGLIYGGMTANGEFTENKSNPQSPVFTLPKGAANGDHTVSYTAKIADNASGSVKNNVIVNNGKCADCSTETPLIQVSTVKTASPSGAVQTGDIVTYTLTTTITGGASTQDITLTDIMGKDLAYNNDAQSGTGFSAPQVNDSILTFTLPKGAAAGKHSVTYTATVGDGADVSNNVTASYGDCPACRTGNPVANVTIAKTVSPKGAAMAGDTLTYTLTAHVTNGPTTRPAILTDTLGQGLIYGGMIAPNADFTEDRSNPLAPVFTLKPGAASGDHTVSYTAKVGSDASGDVKNNVVPQGAKCAGDSACATDTPIAQVSTNKTVSPQGSVMPGDTLTYTLTTTITGGASTQAIVLTDTLGDGLKFGGIKSTGIYAPDTSKAPVLSFTLPAGTYAGTYSVSYTAIAGTNASGTLHNNVTVTSVDNHNTPINDLTPNCKQCETDTPLIVLSSAKSASPAAGTSVNVGDIITYTLTTSVKNGPTKKPVILTDAMGSGLAYQSVSDNPGGFNAPQVSGQNLVFTLPAGKADGTYSVSYTAKVTKDSALAVNNMITPSAGRCDDCGTSNPVSRVTIAKTSDKSAMGVMAGDSVTYTVTAKVSGGASAKDTVLTDTLSPQLDFDSVINAGAFRYDTSGGRTLTFTLPKGTPAGTYKITYAAKVNDSAKSGGAAIANTITSPDADCETSAACGTNSPAVTVKAAKKVLSVTRKDETSTLNDGDAIYRSDIIAYQVTVSVTGGSTSKPASIADKFGASLQNAKITGGSAAGWTQPAADGSGDLTITVPQGTEAGTYTLNYTAEVPQNATDDAVNTLQPDGNSTCAPCSTENPLSGIKTMKLANPAGPVQPGDIITYTLRTNVTGAPLPGNVDLTLNDTPGKGVAYIPGSAKDNSAGTDTGKGSQFSPPRVEGSNIIFTLPRGSAPGTYSVSYQVKVSEDAQAQGAATNTVAPSEGYCTKCTASNPLVQIAVAKTSAKAGKAVQAGSSVPYTLTVKVTNGPTTQPTVLTDNLGANLKFGAVTSAGQFTSNIANPAQPQFTLPAGTPSGSYSISYNATVTGTEGEIKNSVTTDHGSCAPCSVINPPVQIDTVKTSDPADGQPVQAGDIITYTLTTTAEGGPTAQDIHLTDTLNPSVQFVRVLGGSDFIADTSAAPELHFTLKSGAAEGAHKISYQVKVLEAATSDPRNSVITDYGACDNCRIHNPLVSVAVAKTANPPAGAAVQAGDEVTYTLTSTVTGGAATTQNTVLKDTLGAGLELEPESVKPGAYIQNADGSFTLPIGTPAGTYSVTYKARVTQNAKTGIQNSVAATPTGKDNTPTDGGNVPCAPCNVINPVATVSTAKTVTPQGAVQAGDTLTYTLTATVAGGASTQPVLLTDTLGEGLKFGKVTKNDGFKDITADKNQPKFILPAGTAAGTYSVTYTAAVGADAVIAQNKVSALPANPDNTPNTNLPPLPCAPCSTQNPIAVISVAKTANPAAGSAVQAGDTVTYTLTASVKGGASTQPALLTDTLGQDLTFGKVIKNDGFTADISNPQQPQFILPAGQKEGAYSVTYTATVNKSATIGADNSVAAVPANSDNTPNTNLPPLPCEPCKTHNPLATVSTVKTVTPQGAVQAGDTLTYTLTATVAGGASTQPVLLTDTLGKGLSFGAVTKNDGFKDITSDKNQPKFILPAGTAAGTYSITYTAAAGADAVIAQNKVTALPANPDNTPNTNLPPLPCAPCSTQNPIATVSTVKTVSPQGAVQAGDTLTYTLTATVSGGASTQPALLTDTLGKDLTFGQVTKNDGFKDITADKNQPNFILPAGTAAGTYSITYTAKVNNSAAIGADNSVTSVPANPDNTPNTNLPPLPCEPCKTHNPLATISAAKTANPPSGTAVQAGDTITYTLTAAIAGGASTQPVLLSDTLGAGMQFGQVISKGAYNADLTDKNSPKFILPAGEKPGTYSVTYTAIVTKDAIAADNKLAALPANPDGTPDNSRPPLPCEPCETHNPLAVVSVAKTSDPKSGAAVQAGDTISYTLTVHTTGTTTQAVQLDDTLSSSMTFGAVTNAGAFKADTDDAQNPIFTLPAGQAAGDYSVTYTAKVNTDATVAADNSVVPNAVDKDNHKIPNIPPLPCAPCSTHNPLATTTTSKTSTPPSGAAVQAGDTITYTLTVHADGKTSQAVLLTDSLSPSLAFGAVAQAGAFKIVDVSNPQSLKFALPAGAAEGDYSITYTAKVKADATVAADNSVVPQAAGDDNTPIPNIPPLPCPDCETSNPLATVSVAKTASPKDGAAVSKGDTVTYTLTANVKGGAATQNTLLTDSLNDSLSFGEVTDSGAFTADTSNPKALKFTLPAGTPEGSYSVTYTAKVKKDAVMSAQNNVVPHYVDGNNTPIPGGGIIPCEPCSVTNPLIGTSVAKTSSPASGTAVSKGDTITYTLSVTITGGDSTQATLLSDSLSDSLTFGKITQAGQFKSDLSNPKQPKFILPAGQQAGTYSVTYTAMVNKNATVDAQNSVTALPADPKTGTPTDDGGDIPCQPCATDNPLVSLSVAKTASPVTGTAVQKGDTITYTLTETVKGGATTQPTLLTDTLNDSLDFGAVLDSGKFTADTSKAPALKFTLPAGTPAGSYSVTYTAKVKAKAIYAAENNVIPAAEDKDGKTDTDIVIPCDPCATQHPLVGVAAAKTSNPPSGSAVQAGDIITYTLDVYVRGGASTQPVLLTDTLNDSLEFAAFTDKGDFTAANSGSGITALLPSGAAAGEHKISYTARVKSAATLSAQNSVAALPAKPDGTPDNTPDAPTIPCRPCATQNPLATVSVAKTSDVGDGNPVHTGQVLTYTLTATVKGGKSSQAIQLTDSLNDSLSFGEVTQAGAFTADTSNSRQPKFTLPAGQPEGRYSISYTAIVNKDAVTAAQNSVVPQSVDKNNTPIPNAAIIPCAPCSTQNPISSVAAAKTANPAAGAAVQQGDTITYTLTATVAGGISTEDTILTDTLNPSLSFGAVINAGAFKADISAAPKLKFTLPAGAKPGTYSVTYTARVNSDAKTDAQNNVIAQSVDKNGDVDGNVIVPCAPCTVDNPLVSIAASKSSDVGDGTPVQQGDIITYTLKVHVGGGASTQAALLTDTLNPSLDFIKFTDNQGGFTTAEKGSVITALLPKGKAIGDYTVSYQARVKSNAASAAQNTVIAQPADDTGKPKTGKDAPVIPCEPCSTENPLVSIAVSKALDIGTGTPVQTGDVLTYTLDAYVQGGETTQPTLLTDTLGSSLEFIKFTDKGDFTAANDGNAITAILPKGAAAGDHKISYQARVKNDAVNPADNSVKAQPADDTGHPITGKDVPQITCAPCATQNPLVTIATAKTSDAGDGNPVQAGQVITYRLTTAISGGASTQPVTLTDKLSDNLQFVSVSDAGAFTADSSKAPVLSFTLPAGSPAGSYSVSYQVKVKDNAAVGAAQNNVTADKGVCAPCSTQNPIVGIDTVKSSDIGSGAPVQQGDTITYTLATTVSGGNSTAPTDLTDTLDANLQFGKVVDKGAFTPDLSNPAQPKFTLPAGTAPGTYKVTYTAIVKNTAEGGVKNAVTADNGSCSSCETQNPLVTIEAQKTSDVGDGNPVQTGNIITYTAQVTVQGGATTQNTLLTDTLNPSLNFVKISDAGKFTADTGKAPVLKFTLPAGTPAGTYKITYQAQVKANVTADAKNSLTATPADDKGNPPSGPNAPVIPCEPCATTNPITQIAAAKTSDVGDGAPVQRGDTITYTLTVKVTGGNTPQATLLADTLNDSLEFAGIKDAGAFKPDTSAAPELKFLLPAGAAPGTYSVSYQARVTKTAKTDAQNTVTALPANNDGTPDNSPNAPTIPCAPCATKNPLTGISAHKVSDIGDGASVQNGSVISYKLTVDVTGGETTRNTLFTDQMNSNLQYIGIVDCKTTFPADPTMRLLKLKAEPQTGDTSFSAALPAGTMPGSYDYCYQARVVGQMNADPAQPANFAQNTVTPHYADKQNRPVDDPNAPAIPCEPCSTENPISGVQISKSSDVGDGASVVQGQVLTYTLTVNVLNGATTQAINLTDTMDPNLEFIGTTGSSPIAYNADGKSNPPVLTFTAYPGLQPGAHTISYQARVKSDATVKVANSVAARGQQTDRNGKPIPNTETPPLPCEPCATENPITNISASKASDVGDGAAVSAGQLITYTLRVKVEGGSTPQMTLLNDTLNANLTFERFTDKGIFSASGSGNTVTATLPKNTPAGVYTISYQARVNEGAAGKAQNTVTALPANADGTPDNSPDAPAIPCAPCATQNPIAGVAVSKSADVADKEPVHKNQILIYTLKAVVTGGNAPLATLLSDTLNSSLEFAGFTDKGAFTAANDGNHVTAILPQNTPAGTYTISYQARVREDAINDAQNNVTAKPSDNSGNPPRDNNGNLIPPAEQPKVPCEPCSVENPIAGVRASKSSDIGDGTAVHPGEAIIYTLKIDVTGGAAPEATLLSDTLNDSLEFAGFTDKGAFTASNDGNKVTAILPQNTPAGSYAISYKAIVKKDAKADAKNIVTAQPSDNQGNPPRDKSGNLIPADELPKVPCQPCATANPLLSIYVSKTSDKMDDSKSPPVGMPVQAGDIITYTLNVSVSGAGATAQPTLLTDTLSDNLEFVKIVNAGPAKADTSAAPVLKFILPKGTPAKESGYAISYQARVKADAQDKVSNSVAALPAKDDGSPDTGPNAPVIPCAPCATENPLTGIAVSKIGLPGDGKAVKRGDILTYRLTANISGAATVRNILLTDTMNGSLQPIGEVKCESAFKDAAESSAQTGVQAGLLQGGLRDGAAGGGQSGGTVSGQTFSVSVPAGTQAGTYNYCYTARVLLNATDTAQNNVVPNYVDGADKPINDPNLPAIPCAPCSVHNPLSEVSVSKSSDIGDGAHTKAGADIVYKLTAAVTGGETDQATLLTDTLGQNLDFVSVENAGRFKADTSAAPILKFILPAGAEPGSYDVTYRVHVREDAVGKADNSVAANWSDNDGKPPLDPDGHPIPAASLPVIPCKPCQTSNPLDAEKQDIAISKTVAIRNIRRGEQAPYIIRVSNNGTGAVSGLRVVDTAPSGFRFVNKTAFVDRQAATPKLQGRNVIFENISLAPKQTVIIRLNMLALSSVTPGEYTNRAHAEDENGKRLTDDAKAVVEVLAEHVFDCSDVIGTVFDDYNRNGYQDEGEPGLPGVRLATAKGWLITTDTYGRYHIPCAAMPDSRIGSNFILKLDTRTLPTGYRLTTENPRVERLTSGKITKINFGASVSRVVRLDLKNEAFEPGRTALKRQWNDGLALLIKALEKEQSVLRLSYTDAGSGGRNSTGNLADSRIQAVEAQIRKIWGQKRGRYRLEIETRVEVGG